MSTQPKRLTLSEITERLLDARAAHTGSYVSLESTNSGGTIKKVTVLAGTDEAPTVAEASRLAEAEYARLQERFPDPTHDDAKVGLSRTAKGDTQVAVEARTTPDRPTLEKLTIDTIKEYDRARMRYPMADGRTAKPGSVA